MSLKDHTTDLTLHCDAPIYLGGDLCGSTYYTVDLADFMTIDQVEELGRRIDVAKKRAVKKATIEAADILRRLDKSR